MLKINVCIFTNICSTFTAYRGGYTFSKADSGLGPYPSQGKGRINQISGILEDMCFGSYYFEVAFILKNSLFLSSILINCEEWYNLTTSDIETLEQTDEMLKRSVFEAPVSTPRCLLFWIVDVNQSDFCAWHAGCSFSTTF